MLVWREGFSMIEIIIILAVLGIFLGVGTPSYLRWRAETQVQQAATQIAQSLEQQRSAAKRNNEAREVRFSSGDQFRVADRDYTLPQGVSLVLAEPVTVTYFPPYGARTAGGAEVAPNEAVELRWHGNDSIRRVVRVVGVMGKTVIKRD